jgi:hypothetical protein
MRMTDLKAGWAILGNDGRRFGTVKEVSQNYVVASGSGLLGNLYIPASAIANVVDETVHLNLASHEASAMGWDSAPRDEDELLTGPEADLHRHV